MIGNHVWRVVASELQSRLSTVMFGAVNNRWRPEHCARRLGQLQRLQFRPDEYRRGRQRGGRGTWAAGSIKAADWAPAAGAAAAAAAAADTAAAAAAGSSDRHAGAAPAGCRLAAQGRRLMRPGVGMATACSRRPPCRRSDNSPLGWLWFTPCSCLLRAIGFK